MSPPSNSHVATVQGISPLTSSAFGVCVLTLALLDVPADAIDAISSEGYCGATPVASAASCSTW